MPRTTAFGVNQGIEGMANAVNLNAFYDAAVWAIHIFYGGTSVALPPTTYRLPAISQQYM